ncbi:MAG: SufD family Fe-S cluster assembly protein [Finegoldia sp.]|nr:SufD family Fe-S cluster assembly protein [Finegoldia sp.]
MKEIKANELEFKTYKYLRVNDRLVELPDLKYKEYKLDSDPKASDKLEGFGVSEDILALNEDHGNLYKTYVSEEGRQEDFGIIDLVSDDSYDELLDTQRILAKEDSSLKIILNYADQGEKEKFRNSVITIDALKNSTVKVFIAQMEENTMALESVRINAYENSKVIISQYELGGRENYVNTQINLLGEKADVDCNSIYFGHDDQSLDMLYQINHFAKKTKSSCVVNGALMDKAHKIFKSTLDFKEGSSESEGTEEEYAVLLSDDAKSISIPLLLSHEDDVAGNHAASAGKIDQAMLFYIMSRGIALDIAEAMVVESRFSQSLSRVDNPQIYDKVLSYIRKRMYKAKEA